VAKGDPDRGHMVRQAFKAKVQDFMHR
jgi:hypothetical protein